MLLTRKEFDEQYAAGELSIALIGMSNIGKSHRSKQMVEALGFSRIGIDHEIAAKIGKEDVSGVSDHLGQPYEKDFVKKQEHYLRLESEETQQALERESMSNLVIDTTGSLIYLDLITQQHVQKNCLVLYLHTSEEMLGEMMEAFFAHPKPLIWGESFDQRAGEINEESLRRCYPELLQWRGQHYKQFADITIDGKLSRSPDVSIEDFWEMIREQLPE